jgi:hypothetical protein
MPLHGAAVSELPASLSELRSSRRRDVEHRHQTPQGSAAYAPPPDILPTMSDAGVADPVVVLSEDPFLVLALESVVAGPVHFISDQNLSRSSHWPHDDACTVIVDVPADQRSLIYKTVRHHHHGRLILALDPGETDKDLPWDPARLTVTRPYLAGDLATLLMAPSLGEQPARPVPAAREAPRSGAGIGNGTPARQIGPTPALRRAWWPGTVADRRSPRGLVMAALLMSISLLGFIVWFVAGLLQAGHDIELSAQAVRADLDQVDSALLRGNTGEAEQAVKAASTDLRSAQVVAYRPAVRLAGRLPGLSQPVDDLDRLIGAAHRVVRAAERAVMVYSQLASESPTMLRGQRFDLELLARATGEVNALYGDINAAREELLAVRGTPLEPRVERTKAAGLRQLDALESRARPVVRTLNVLPSVLGSDRPRTYLVVLTNPAELRPSGGTPTAVLRVIAHRGVITLQNDMGATRGLPDSRARWRAVPGDPWQGGAAPVDFSKANSSPHFPTSGEELLRAYQAKAKRHTDGVISIDPFAARAVLTVTGPLAVPGYGQVTPGNVARLTMHDAFGRWPDATVRNRYNQALTDALLRQFLDGRLLLAKAKALESEASQRHIQIYARDPHLQAAVTEGGLDGGLGPAEHDYMGVYTQNTNASRVDYFQTRSIRQEVQLLTDGSALVTRTIRIANPTSAGMRPTAARGGPLSRHSMPIVATYLPPTATLLSVYVDGRRSSSGMEREEAGRRLVRVDARLGPGDSVTVGVVYKVRSGAEVTIDGLRYEFLADPQPMSRPPRLEIQVTAPTGMAAQPSGDWHVQGQRATLTLAQFVERSRASLDLHRD